MSSLTDRYVQATLRRLPVRQRTDIEQELRASIADDRDDRSLPVAIAGSVASVTGAAVLGWTAATDHLLNPAFVEAAGWPAGTDTWLTAGLIALAGWALLQTIFDAFGYARRS